MPAKLLFDNKQHIVIRPRVYVSKNEARVYTHASKLSVINCYCLVCGDLSIKRQRLKRLLFDFEAEHAGVENSRLKALKNVAPRHLLDTRLNPPGNLRVRAVG